MEIATPVISGGLLAASHRRTASKSEKSLYPVSSINLQKVTEHRPSLNIQRLKLEKYVFLSVFFLINFTLIYMSMNMAKFFWIVLPIYFFKPVVDFIEIIAIIIAYPTRRILNPRRPKTPETLENLVYLLPCYNETYAELMNSLNSLAEQKHLDAHNKAIIIICDGQCKGPGMKKTTAEHLAQDIIEKPSSTLITEGYTSWNGTQMDVEVVKGEFRGLPVFCIIKAQNRGKRDGIILIRSFLHKFNQRHKNPSVGILSPGLFSQASNFLVKSTIPSVEYVIGMDADTRFDSECVINLIQTVREGEQVVGVCGYLLADLALSHPLSLPSLYQNAEYNMGQHRRRLRQDLTSRKVSCLPGCCQLLRVIESTCGDDILGRFGYHPTESDGLFRTIRSMMSEDRDHVCLILCENADVEIRQCLNARAYTSVPQTISVFLSQRRRWTLGPITSDVLLAIRKTTGWAERLAALASTFDFGVILFLFHFRWFRDAFSPEVNTFYVFLVLCGKIWDYSVAIATAISFKGACQNVFGCFLCYTFGHYVGITVKLYSLYHLNDFRWGKTRIICLDDDKKHKE